MEPSAASGGRGRATGGEAPAQGHSRRGFASSAPCGDRAGAVVLHRVTLPRPRHTSVLGKDCPWWHRGLEQQTGHSQTGLRGHSAPGTHWA